MNILKHLFRQSKQEIAFNWEVYNLAERAWDYNVVKPGLAPAGRIRPYARSSYNVFVSEYIRDYHKAHGRLPFGRHRVSNRIRTDIVVFPPMVITSSESDRIRTQKT